MNLNFIFHPYAQRFILSLIAINTVTIGMQTSPLMNEYFGDALDLFNDLALAVFTVELSIKIIALRLKFFKDPWNIFDFLIVSICYLPVISGFTVLRALRILRVSLLISTLPKLRILVQSLLLSVPSLGWLFLLLALIFYLFSVIATILFGNVFPELFGSIGSSIFTLFQVMTLDSWSMDVARPVMDAFPYAFLFFVPFVLICTFIVLNVIVAIIVNGMCDARDKFVKEKKEKRSLSQDAELIAELDKLKAQISTIEKIIDEKNKI